MRPLPHSWVLLLVAIGFGWAATPSFAQTTIHVDDDAPDDPAPGDTLVSDPLEDGSARHPFDAIAEAIAVAAASDEVLIRDGLYQGAGNFDLLVDETITIRSENGNNRTTIDCQGNGTGFVVIGASPTIEGLKIVGGQSFVGGGMRVFIASPTVVDCVFDGNRAVSSGGGLHCEDSSPRIVDCVFTDNEATDFGGAISVRLGSTPTITGCTLANNRSPLGVGGGMFAGDSSESTITNSILWANVPEQLYIGFPGTVSVDVSFSDVQGGSGRVVVEPGGSLNWLTGNLDADPLFVDLAAGDVHLLSPSPCIDVGNPAVLGNLATDFEGDPRQHGAIPDIGADEFHPHIYVSGLELPGRTISVRIVGRPGAPVVLGASFVILGTPVSTPAGDLFLGPFLGGGIVPLGPRPAQGLLEVHVGIPGTLPPFTRVGLQALVKSQLTNLEVLEIF